MDGKVYKVHYDAQHPERSHVTEYIVKRELVQVGGANWFQTGWHDLADPHERMFRTREEADACLKELLEGRK